MQEKLIFNGDYSVTDDGRVISYKRKGKQELVGGAYGGYRIVTIWVNGKQENHYVHRLVAEAFIPNPEDKPEVNHKDGNKQNNNVNNLEWCTSSENNYHAQQQGLCPTAQCVICGRKCRDFKRRICKKCKVRIIDFALTAIGHANKAEQNKKFYDGFVASGTSGGNAEKFMSMRVSGMSFEEIAKATGCTKQNVAQTIKLALKKACR